MPSRTIEKQIVVSGSDGKTRLDKYVASLGEVPRSVFQDRNVQIAVNGKKQKKSVLVHDGDRIFLTYTESFFEGVKAEDIPLDVLYVDNDVLVIDKAQGMVVHPAAGNWDGTLVGALLFRYGSGFVDEEGDELRPGIVHRLDKDTSGTMVVARNPESQRRLVEQFKAHTTRKVYIAIVKGCFPSDHGVIETGIKRSDRDRKKFCTCPLDEGKRASTEYQILRRYRTCSLARITIKTGRTHQIRVHMSSIGHPVVGDPIYGRGDDKVALMLHAFILSFDQPMTGRRLTFRSPMPERFKQYLNGQRSRI